MDDEAGWDEELAHFRGVLQAWHDYLRCSVRDALTQLYRNKERRDALYMLPHAHQALLAELRTAVPGPHASASARGVKGKLDEVDDRIRRNADVLESIASFCRSFLGMSLAPEDDDDVRPTRQVSEHDQDRVRTAMKQMARDWSADGAAERQHAYAPLLDAVATRLGDARRRRVLVPGAGLGRLAFEFARQGYVTQGNEFSYFMLVPAHFILNATTRVDEHTLYPYVHSQSNWVTAADMLRGVSVPDVLPSVLPPGSDFSMVAGDFLEVYTKPEERGAWDVVATCYFLDTAKNVLRYLEVINAVLPIGGYWVNVGPLLWHFEHDKVPTVELTCDEILALLPRMGFEIEEHRRLGEQAYTGVPHSMLSHAYTPMFWVCRKVAHYAMAPSV